MLLRAISDEIAGPDRFRRPLHVAMQSGLYLHSIIADGGLAYSL